MQSSLQAFPKLLILAALLAFGQACDKDADPREEANNRLNGDWEVTSLTINGVEVIPTTYASFDMEYKKEDPFSGTAEWTLITASSGQTEKAKGDYEVQADGREIDFEGDDLDLEFRDDDRIELDGVVNGRGWKIKAKRD